MLPGCKDLFPFRDGIVNLDHGGFGVTAREIHEARLCFLEKIEHYPPRAFFEEEDDDSYRLSWRRTAALTAERFSGRPQDMALISNVTDGANAILQCLSFRHGDEILIGSLAYGAIVNIIETLAHGKNAVVTRIPFKFPHASTEQCIAALERSLTPRTKLVILDHITSSTALVMPVAEMIRVCRNHGAAVLVDGAHAPGNVFLDLEALDADWYIANLHKWYFVPRSCGFLWARSYRQEKLRPAILSWNIHEPFPRSFEWTGTRDPSPLLSIPAAFAFMDRFGETKVREHNKALVIQGMEILAKTWNVRIDTPKDMIAAMGLVPLPDRLSYEATIEKRKALQNFLWQKHKIACPCILHEGHLYVRISAQIYNDARDYECLAEAVRNL